MFLYFIFIFNGIYDILCALCILQIINIHHLDNLHLDMFHNHLHVFEKRFLAYWIMSYGFMRLSNDHYLICISYLLEAIVFTNEYIYYNQVKKNNCIFVVITSLFLACLAIVF
ncbi:hypothetical protein HN415_10265 [Candidatus Woesearchaeota archaeon]|nr:hypothetical protein [Candidatus Woesearchaeota archaeon]